jgi:subtilase family serine protease
MTMTRERVRRVGAAGAATLVAISLLAGCTPSSAGVPVSLPVPKAGDVTFYLSLPTAPATGLGDAAAKVATPGSSGYRHFSSLDQAARQYGATDAQIRAVASSIGTLGLQFAADPTRLFARVTGSTSQWQAALGSPLAAKASTSSNPFITYSLPARTPAALQPSGTALLLPQTEVYDPTADPGPAAGGKAPAAQQTGPAPDASASTASEPWPVNAGTPLLAACSSPLLQQRRVYTPQQVQTAYGVDTLRGGASGTPVITIVDLGGGWSSNDLALAAQCFGYSSPQVTQMQGDGVATAINSADDETSLDLQTVAAVAPGAQLRVVQSTLGGVLDAFSRATADPRGLPDVISLSYGECAYAENRGAPQYAAVTDGVLAMIALTGVSSFVAAGDSGSTVCGAAAGTTTLSYPAVSPYVTAVGGTRLTLGPGNTRVSETVWNDSAFGANAAGGGALSRLQPRPAYQDAVNPQSHRAVPDVSALADTVPGWPLILNSTLQTVGGTSGSTPFTAAATALVDGSQRAAGRPRIGLANGWFYQAATQPSAFFDVTTGSNDIGGVGCCQAAAGYDLASGIGVPNWAVLPAALPNPG